jgi:hypothetical protein
VVGVGRMAGMKQMSGTAQALLMITVVVVVVLWAQWVQLDSKNSKSEEEREKEGIAREKYYAEVRAKAAKALTPRDKAVRAMAFEDVYYLEGTRAYLNCTRITDEDLKEIAKLQQLTAISIRLPNLAEQFPVNITDRGLKEIAKLQNLSDLNLRYTQITDEGLKEIAKMQQLTTLTLGSKITDEGLKEIAKLQQLTDLRLLYNEITDEGLKEIAKLQKLAHLRIGSLSMDNGPLTEEAVAELKKALPKCQMFVDFK